MQERREVLRDSADPPRAVVSDSLGWDVATWARALPFWTARTRVSAPGRVLEVGAGGDNGGLSLWLATRGYDVTCTGLEPPSERKLALHAAHGVADRITCATADVLDLPWVGEFDLVVFKSVLGRVGADDRPDRQAAALEQLHRALRPGGELWWAENAAATPLHRAGRRAFGAGRWHWRYVELAELPALLAPFDDAAWTTFGVSAGLGRTERQRQALARLDAAVLDRVVPPHWRYVVAGVARRS